MLIPAIGSRFCSIASIRSRAREPVRVRVRHRDKLDSVQIGKRSDAAVTVVASPG